MDIGKIIAKAHRLSQVYIAEALKDAHIKAGQFSYILCICDNPGISQEELAGELLVDKSSAAKAVKQLIADGFISRETNETDRRAYRLYPTQKSLDSYSLIQQSNQGWQDELFQNMTPVEIDFFIRLLEKLAIGGKKTPAAKKTTA